MKGRTPYERQFAKRERGKKNKKGKCNPTLMLRQQQQQKGRQTKPTVIPKNYTTKYAYN